MIEKSLENLGCFRSTTQILLIFLPAFLSLFLPFFPLPNQTLKIKSVWNFFVGKKFIIYDRRLNNLKFIILFYHEFLRYVLFLFVKTRVP